MNELDLTKGSVPHVLLRFALPYLLANVLQALYGGADLFVVGRFDDAASVAGVAIGSQVMQTVTGSNRILISHSNVLKFRKNLRTLTVCLVHNLNLGGIYYGR